MTNLTESLKDKSNNEVFTRNRYKKRIYELQIGDYKPVMKNVYSLLKKEKCTKESNLLVKGLIDFISDENNKQKVLILELYNDIIKYTSGVEYFREENLKLKNELSEYYADNAILKYTSSNYAIRKAILAKEKPVKGNKLMIIR